ncbi:hypothetical protein [Methylobacterium frigidaeris]|uniref:hypothetical protein n=1 Tax=Methylobacterium frigidaeris TaxID=2038277 RepID=UPI0034D952C6
MRAMLAQGASVSAVARDPGASSRPSIASRRTRLRPKPFWRGGEGARSNRRNQSYLPSEYLLD